MSKRSNATNGNAALWIGGLILVVVIGLVVLAVLNKQGKSGPGLLVGQSENWKAAVLYTNGPGGLVEVPSVEMLRDISLEAVTVSIKYKKQASTEYSFVEPTVTLKPNAPVQLDTRTIVKSWKDTEHVEIWWKSGGREFKEYIYPTNQMAETK